MSTTTVRSGVISWVNAVVVDPTLPMTDRELAPSVRMTSSPMISYVIPAPGEATVWKFNTFVGPAWFGAGSLMQTADRSSRSNVADTSRAASTASEAALDAVRGPFCQPEGRRDDHDDHGRMAMEIIELDQRRAPVNPVCSGIHRRHPAFVSQVLWAATRP